jgi:hypothetical protein
MSDVLVLIRLSVFAFRELAVAPLPGVLFVSQLSRHLAFEHALNRSSH